jgi:hypothetical protein
MVMDHDRMEDEYAMGLKNSYMPVKRPYLINDANRDVEKVKRNRTMGPAKNLHKTNPCTIPRQICLKNGT